MLRLIFEQFGAMLPSKVVLCRLRARQRRDIALHTQRKAQASSQEVQTRKCQQDSAADQPQLSNCTPSVHVVVTSLLRRLNPIPASTKSRADMDTLGHCLCCAGMPPPEHSCFAPPAHLLSRNTLGDLGPRPGATLASSAALKSVNWKRCPAAAKKALQISGIP